MKITKLIILLFLLSLRGIAQTPTFGNTGVITLCVNGSYYLNPSTTDGTFSTLSSTIATVNSSGYVTGVSEGSTTVSFVATVGGGTVSATVTVVSSSGLSITDPSAQSSYKFNNNPQGPVGGLNNYVGYNGFSYSSQARPSNTGFFRASNQSGNNSGCPFEYDIFRCTTCGTVPEYTTRPQGSFSGSTINQGQTGQLTYTSSNGVVGPYTFVYYDGVSNITVNNKSSAIAFDVASRTPAITSSYTLISVTEESTNSSSDFSGTTAIISVGISIGSQMWAGKNLDVTNYRNGDIIPQVTDPTAWAGLTTGAWCYYNDNTAYGVIYGKLYNWHAVNDPRGLAPAGWHIPTYEEWTNLGFSLGGNSIAGGKMKATGTNTDGTGLWDPPNSDATNISGFSGLPGGSRWADGTFYNVGVNGFWWSVTQASPGLDGGGFYNRLQNNDATLVALDNPKKSGMSVRLIKGDHYVGESFGGGKVAYILVSGDLGYDANAQHGLIAANTDQSTGIIWGFDAAIPGATGYAIGTGMANTTAIISIQGNTGSYAAKLARNYSDGIYHDWYLPSSEELNKLYINRATIKNFDSQPYWSSSDFGHDYTYVAISQNFSNGLQGNSIKSSIFKVRAVRKF